MPAIPTIHNNCRIPSLGSKKEAGYAAFVVNGWDSWHMKVRLKDHVGVVGCVQNQAMRKCVDLLKKDQHIDVTINIQSEAAKKSLFYSTKCLNLQS
jgi:hypothetical protein